MHRSRWGGYHYRITGKDAGGEVTYEGGWQNNRQMGMHKDFRMVENIFEELDAPGEWFHDAESQHAVLHAGRRKRLGKCDGRSRSSAALDRIHGQRIRARQFHYATRIRRSPCGSNVHGDQRAHAAQRLDDLSWRRVLLTGTEDVNMLDSEFDQVGGNAIFVNNYNRRRLVKGCHIHDIGASGVCFVGDPDAVRDPLFEYRQKNDLSKIDRTPGPKTNNYPADCVVEDCLIHGIGRVERQPAGVQIEMAAASPFAIARSTIAPVPGSTSATELGVVI